MKRKSPIFRHFLHAGLLLAVVIVINLIAGFKFFRIDLTADQIHSLHSDTKTFITEEIDDVVNIEVYLDGEDLPPSLQKFKQSIKDKLKEFQAYAGNNIKFQFIDIKKDTVLYQAKLEDFNRDHVDGNRYETQINGAQKDFAFYPILQFRHQTYVYHVDLMSDYNRLEPVSDQYIDNQTYNIEYKLVTGLHHVIGRAKPTISFLRGHGETPDSKLQSTVHLLEEYYNVDCVYVSKVKEVILPIRRYDKDNFRYITETGQYQSVSNLFFSDTSKHLVSGLDGTISFSDNAGRKIIFDTLTLLDTNKLMHNYPERLVYQQKIDALDNTDMLIISKPKNAISDRELFLIDQFIMRGGKTIWALDMIDAHEDSLQLPMGHTYSTPNNHFDNIEKMLYRYGAGIKKNFISNSICASQLRHDQRMLYNNKGIPIDAPYNTHYYRSPNNDSLRIDPVINNWYPFACVTVDSLDLHKNVSRVKLQYPSEVNINAGATGVTQTIILESDASFKEFPSNTRIFYDKNIFVQDVKNRGEVSGEYYDPQRGKENLTGRKAPLGCLIEGEIKSYFNINQLDPAYVDGMNAAGLKFKESSKSNSIAVIGDGDILQDERVVTRAGLYIFNVNKDFNSNNEIIYGNSIFFHNLIDRMMGNEHLIPLRSRMKVTRILNKDATLYSRGKWQAINLIIPSIIVLLYGGIQLFIRRRRFTAK